MSDTTQTPHSPLTCEACRIVDTFDGKEDGKVFGLDHWQVASEHGRWQKARQVQDEVADKVTGFAGSLNFVYLHGVWFGIWILLNIGILGAGVAFDKYPFGLLTMVVSLEAIFLSTFVMVSQNRQAARSDIRSQVDFESNLQSLIWLVHLAAKLEIDIEHVEGLCTQAIAESRKLIPAST
jgi:uncharacterized membrane protein